MCGIAGIVKLNPDDTVDEARVKRMRDVLRHRGPDGEGLWLDGPVGLGHRRLSIVDVAAGHQPMANEDETVWITYNGEIYNHARLRSELEANGHRYRTRSDTETIVHSYEEYGERCVERLQGMFAFAIWDRRQSRLLLARDRLGIKPLYYAVTDDELLFASEIKGILAGWSHRPTFNEAVLPEYLANGFVAGADTFFRGIRKLLPGRTLSWSPREGIRERRYWHLPTTSDESGASRSDLAAEVRDRLAATVKSHLMSDVPLGLFLSGGIDSSGLAALMAPMADAPIRTFSVGFAEPGANELPYARLAARWVGAVHREVTATAGEFWSALPQLVWHEDEPIAFPSSVALYFVSRLAREHVKVVLTGEGADELFIGYNRYRLTAWNRRLGLPYRAVVPRVVREPISRLTRRLPLSVRRYVGRSFLAVPGGGPRDVFYENFAVFPRWRQAELLADARRLDEQDPYADALRCYGEAPGGMLRRMSHADLQTYLVELLMKQDQMSMAASVESRVPFLDHEFVERIVTMPSGAKLSGLRTKAVLRDALAKLVPPEILARRKMGFPVPVGRWLRGLYRPLVDDLVTGERLERRGLFQAGALRRLADEHRAGSAEHGDRLWLLANLELWHRIFIDGEDPAAVARAVA